MIVSKLHHTVILAGLAVFVLLVFGSLGFSQDRNAGNTIMSTSSGSEYIVSETVSPSSVYVAPCEECGCDGCASSAHNCGLRANLSATACFNCRTNGSYKFPVPRQYTYFWPGIYSQKTMTEYVAPFTGLKLRSPSEVFDNDLEQGK